MHAVRSSDAVATLWPSGDQATARTMLGVVLGAPVAQGRPRLPISAQSGHLLRWQRTGRPVTTTPAMARCHGRAARAARCRAGRPRSVRLGRLRPRPGRNRPVTTRPTRPCDRGRPASKAPRRRGRPRSGSWCRWNRMRSCGRPATSSTPRTAAPVPVQDHELLAGGRVPDADGGIGGDRSDSPAVRRPGGPLLVIFVPPQREQFPAISGVPDLGGAVIGAGRDAITRRGPGDSPAGLLMAAQDDQLPSGRGIPEIRWSCRLTQWPGGCRLGPTPPPGPSSP